MDDELRRRGRQRAAYTAFLATRLDRTSIMRRAWALARAFLASFGGTVCQHLAAALRQSWAEYRARVAVFHERAEAWS